jgi:hypothetical protein
MKTFFKLLLFVFLLALPFGVRYWQYHGLPTDAYQPPQQTTPDFSTLQTEPLAYQSYADQPQVSHGRVLVDMAHGNNLLVDDLTPLQERLAARGADVRTYTYDNDSLSEELRSATAFVVIAPTWPFYLEEIQAIEEFVAQGGRLLLVADPTRSVPADDSYGYVDMYALFFPESAVPAINSLANRFGIQFFEDYLYNLEAYQVNYRNVTIGDFAASDLTAGLDEVILFAAHSLQSDGPALLIGDANTRSNVRTGETALAAAALGRPDNVLALGDLTLLIAPTHRAADNDRFLSNLADWLAQDTRAWRLQDFPYLFTRPVELIAVTEQNLQPAVLNVVSSMQQALTQAGLSLTWSQQPTAGRDHLVAGLFEETAPISDVLASAGISVTLVTTLEDAEEVTETAANEDAEGEEASTPTPAAPAVSTVTIAGMGKFTLDGLQLFLLTQASDSTALTILASDYEGLGLAVQRLLYRDFAGCTSQGTLTLCATDSYATWQEPEQPTPAPTPDDPGESAAASVLIVTVDQGFGQSSADAWQTALGDFFDVTIWSVSLDGVPTLENLSGYDAYIVDSSDFAYDPALWEELSVFTLGENFLLIGEQPLDPEFYSTAPLLDLVVSDPQHPLAFELTSADNSPIVLQESYSGVPAVIFEPFEEPTEGVTVVFARGPQSDAAQSPVVVAYDSGEGGPASRFALAGFAFYRLPESEQYLFAYNVVNWLLGR